MKYELLIAGRTDPEAHRRKEGDVVDVHEHPCNWGRKEIDDYFVVIVDSDEDLTFLAEETLKSESGEDISICKYQIPLEIIKDWIPNLDLDKIRDEKYIYQPFKSSKQLVKKFIGGVENYSIITLNKRSGIKEIRKTFKRDRIFLDETDCDCICVESDSTSEFIINSDEQVSLIKDKQTGKFKYSKRKVL